jgi:uncharacterized membrane protein
LADAAIVTALAFLHVASAIAWLGGVTFFLSAVAPGVRSLTPGARLEYLARVGPRQVRFFVGSASATIVFGLALLFALYGADYTAWPASIDVGFSLGLLAYLIAVLVTTPAFRKVEAFARQVMDSPQSHPPPPELATYLKRGTIGAISVAVILALATLFMVGTAFY